MPRCRLVVIALLLAVVSAGCDTTPGDPLDARGDLAALLEESAAGPGQPAPFTLPGLLHSAVHKVHTEQGTSAARALVSELRRLQEEARIAVAAGDRDRAAAHLAAVHEEQLRIVLRVFGPGVVDRVIAGVSLEAARLGRAVDEAEAAGRDMHRARASLATIQALLDDAAAAAASGHAAAALDAATRAARYAGEVRHAVAQARRIPGLEELFDVAVARLRSEVGPDAARAALADYNALRRAADEAVRAGDRQRAHRALEKVRAEQIRFVLEVLGPDAVRRLLDAVARGADEVDAELAAARLAGRDVSRLARMATSARDMLIRAQTQFDDGDPASALDLASHAAGLLNAVRLGLAFG
jgi:hypothetical protein